MTDLIRACTRPSDVPYADWPDCARCVVPHCGYSRYRLPNPYWPDSGGICRFEHCIETMPIRTPRDPEFSCPIFGHDCPGGIEAVTACRAQADRARIRRNQ